MLRPNAYIRVFAAITAGTITLVALFNFLVDPYDINRVVRVTWLNAEKPRAWEHARLRKPLDLFHLSYEGIALGTSQVERGFDPNNPAMLALGMTLYNAGLSEERPYEQALLLRLAAKYGRAKFAFVSLDFLRYVGGGGKPEFIPPAWTPSQGLVDYTKTIVSLGTARDSIVTIWSSWRKEPALQHLPGGLLNVESLFSRIGYPDTWTEFVQIDSVYLNSAYQLLIDNRAHLERTGFDHDAVREMVRIANQYHVRVIFFVPPFHARQAEIIAMLGLGPLFRQWRSELANFVLNAPAADEGLVALWDFSGFNSVTTESVPALNSGRRMRWYYDPVHYTPLAGRAMEDRMLGLSTPELAEIPDFGALITPANLATHFDQEREARDRYLREHPDVSSELEKLYRRPVASAGQ